MARTDNITIPQGSDHRIQWPLRDADGQAIPLAGWTARAQARTRVRDDQILAEWTTENGGIALADSTLTLVTTHAESSAWTWAYGVYDIELVSPTGDVTRLTAGTIALSLEVTR